MDQNQRRKVIAEWIAVGGDVRKSGLTPSQRRLAARCEPSEVARAVDARIVVPGDDEFPEQVGERLTPPGVWFVRGELAEGRKVAFVGARKASVEAERVTSELASAVARAGVIVVSGGARGVDTVAHRAALGAGGRTVAILPSSLDQLTPATNRGLFEQIAKQGALITEYPPGTPVRKHHFARRNAIIAAYADAVVVVRAARKGGTMITARIAQSMELPLFAVPGSPHDQTSQGCHELLRDGARCVATAQDLLADLGMLTEERPVQAELALPRMSESAAGVFAALGGTVAGVDEICVATSMRAHQVLTALTELEVAGLVCSEGASWRRLD